MATPDDELRLLSIFHYVLAGFSGLFCLIPLAYLGFGIAILAGALGEGKDAPPTFFGVLVTAIGALMLLLAAAMVVGLVLAGRYLARRRRWLFCMVMAGISCAFFPFGTVLGVFTIVVLSKLETKALFAAGQPKGA